MPRRCSPTRERQGVRNSSVDTSVLAGSGRLYRGFFGCSAECGRDDAIRGSAMQHSSRVVPALTATGGKVQLTDARMRKPEAVESKGSRRRIRSDSGDTAGWGVVDSWQVGRRWVLRHGGHGGGSGLSRRAVKQTNTWVRRKGGPRSNWTAGQDSAAARMDMQRRGNGQLAIDKEGGSSGSIGRALQESADVVR